MAGFLKKTSKAKKTTKKQRNRFVAFAFASADLFIEISPKNKILYVYGAAKALTGQSEQQLLKTKWLDLFAPDEHTRLSEIKDKATPGIRCTPTLIDLNERSGENKALLTAIKLPGDKNLYITLSFHSPLPVSSANSEEAPLTTGFKAGDEDAPAPLTTGYNAKEDTPEILTTGFKAEKEEEPETLTTGYTPQEEEEFDDSIYNKGKFIDKAEEIFEFARTQNIEPAVTVFDFGRSQTVTEENWAEAMEKISGLLRTESLDKKTAGEIAEGRYSFVHDAKTDPEAIAEKIAKLCAEAGLDEDAINISSKTTTDLEEFSNEETAKPPPKKPKAPLKADNKSDNTDDDPKPVVKKQLNKNEEKLKEFKSIVDRVDFDIVFQPIVEIKTKEPEFYETLTRFRQGETKDWIKFGEDVGLSTLLDLAVVERTLNYIHYKASTTRTKFSINISSKSIEQAGFTNKLLEQLAKRDLKHRIILEITNAAQIENMKKTIDFSTKLTEFGYNIALDNFSPSQSCMNLLDNTPVRLIKLDEKHIAGLLTSKEEAAQIARLSQTCKKKKIGIVAVSVEEQAQADILTEIGIMHAQGHLYGKAASNPSFIPPSR
ncbi:MAG: EAL domain-containing protein [Alphaproteobacteria bacterium]